MRNGHLEFVLSEPFNPTTLPSTPPDNDGAEPILSSRTPATAESLSLAHQGGVFPMLIY